MILLAARLANDAVGQARSLSHADRNASSQIGKGKCATTIAAVCSTDKSKEHGVLRNAQYRSVAKQPSGGSKVERNHLDLTDERIVVCNLFGAAARSDCVFTRLGKKLSGSHP